MRRFLSCFSLAACLALFIPFSPAKAEEDEQILLDAGLSGEGPALLAFFHARAQTEIDRERLRLMVRQFAEGSRQERERAGAELLGMGPLALPAMRQLASDLDRPELSARASRCLNWMEGPGSSKLLIAAARTLAQRKPEGAAGALLAYLPLTIDAEVIAAVNEALSDVAATNGKPDPAILRGLTDSLAVRRAAAGVALCKAVPPDRVPEVRKLLKDPAAGVRLRAAMALAEAHDADAIPVLIDLLAELNAEKRAPVEEFLTKLAGEWAPLVRFPSDDKIARKIRRDAWAAWWQNTNGEALLAALREHTLTPESRAKVRTLLANLGSDDFGKREAASRDIFVLGRIALPQLREASKSKDPEVARRSKRLIQRIEREPAHRLPLAALRLLGVRKPNGAAAALLAYLPHADEESQSEEVRKTLTTLAARGGKGESALVEALADERALLRAAAAEALAAGGGAEGRAEARKLLRDKDASVRLTTALALARAREKDAVPVLIALLTELPGADVGRAEDALYQLAGDSAPKQTPGSEAAERKKFREAWAAWWKENANRVDLAKLTDQPWYGYTLICAHGQGRVYEIDRHGKERWSIGGLSGPADACMVRGNRVLIAEWNAGRVTERDLKGKIIWEARVNSPVNVQRLPNGHTVAGGNGAAIVEFDRAGKQVYSINSVPGNLLASYRSREGTIVCTNWQGQCLFYDTTGKQLKSFATGQDANSIGGLDLMPNGHILVSRQAQGKVAEYDREGKLVREIATPGVRTATALRNGHVLVASQNNARVYEVDREGKIVWEHKNPGNAFRARRR